MNASHTNNRFKIVLTVLSIMTALFSASLHAEDFESSNSVYNASLYVRNYSPAAYNKERFLENFGYMHITLPLEVVIGRFYLSDESSILSAFSSALRDKGSRNSLSLNTDSDPTKTQIPVIAASAFHENPLPDIKRRDSIKIYQINKNSSFVGFDFLRLHAAQIGNYRYGDTLLGSISMGYSLKDKPDAESPVNVLLGLTSIYSTPERKNLIEVSGTEYGTVFFVPGLQISGKSVMFQAMLELPIYRINPENAIYHQQDLRANFGMKYIIR